MRTTINEPVIDDLAPKRRTRVTQGKDYWQGQIEAWQDSGLCQTQYCRENDVSLSTFNCWKGKLLGHNQEPNRKTQLVPVKVVSNNISIHNELSITTPNGFQLKVPVGLDFNAIRPLLKELCSLS